MTAQLKANREDAISKARHAHYALQLQVRELKKTLDDSQKEKLNTILVLMEERGIETARSMVIDVELKYRSTLVGNLKSLIKGK